MKFDDEEECDDCGEVYSGDFVDTYLCDVERDGELYRVCTFCRRTPTRSTQRNK